MDISARVTVLERVPLFNGLKPEEREAVAREAHERPLKKGDVLFQQGEEAAHNYVLGWGRVRLDQTTPDGQNVVLRFMGPGDLIGTVAVLRRMPFPATPTAIEDSMLLAWSAGRTADLMTRYPTIALNAINVIGGRVEELQARLREVATQRVERRIASTLLRMVRQSGRRVDAGVEIPFVISRNELAEMTATTLHTVSRTLAAWEQEGILTGKRTAHLVITQPHRLVEIAEQA
ncbi:MAG TPA: Crp/Fnr family transcriptional regulator [Thalassobaculum sp.]